MVSIRRQFLDAIAARFDAVAGWTVVTRDRENEVRPSGSDTKTATVYAVNEGAELNETGRYQCELDIVVRIRVFVEDAGGNAFSYADAALTELQQVLHADPEDYGVTGVQNLEQAGHAEEPPDERNIIGIQWRLRGLYFHDYDDPETYTGIV